MIKNIIKVIFSIAILFLLFHAVKFHTLLPYFHQMTPLPFLAAYALVLLSNLIAGFRWALVMRTLKAPWKPFFYVKTFFKGVMFNQILPSSIGGDGFRMFEVTRIGVSKRDAINSVLADRVIGFAAVILLSLSGLYMCYLHLSLPLFHLLAVVTGGGVFALLCAIGLHYIRHPLPVKYCRWFYDISKTINTSISSSADLFVKLALGMIANILNISAFYLIAKAIGVDAHFMDLLVIVPYVTLIMMVPISMAGWGLREGAMVVLGASFGLAHGASMAISLLYGFTLILGALPGLYFNTIGRSIDSANTQSQTV